MKLNDFTTYVFHNQCNCIAYRIIIVLFEDFWCYIFLLNQCCVFKKLPTVICLRTPALHVAVLKYLFTMLKNKTISKSNIK